MFRSHLATGLVAIAAIAAGVVVAMPSAKAAVDGPKLNWTWASYANPRPGTAVMDKLIELVGAETNGNFTIKIVYGETLAPAKEILDGIKIGAFEGGFWAPPFAPGKQPSESIFNLPFLPFGDWANAIRIADVYHRHPAVKRDFDAWSAAFLTPILIPGYEFIGRGEPPKALADWKGKRVRALGGHGQAMAKVGAVPTTVTSPEIYGTLERGVIDAAALPLYAFSSYKLHEVGKWYTMGLGLGYSMANVALNAAAYEKLPAQYRTVLNNLLPSAQAAHIKALADDDEKTLALLKGKGLHEVVIPTAMRDELIRIGGQPVWDDWVKEMTAKGYPGQELLDVILTEAKKNRPS